MDRRNKRLLIALLVVLLLAIAAGLGLWLWAGQLAVNASSAAPSETVSIPPSETARVTTPPSPTSTFSLSPTASPSPEPSATPTPSTTASPSSTPTPPPTAPVVETPSETPPEAREPVCTLSISCADVLDRWEDLSEDKRELVPPDGVIFPATEVTFTAGESAFDILLRVCREEKIHLEFSETPLYQSAYIEGIANLYEKDCGDLSGWTYRVNGVTPNYGCSQYALADGDTVEWVYVCDFTAID